MTDTPTPAHTPGPWTADLGEAFHIRDTRGGSLAQLKFLKGRGGLAGRRNGDEVAANARLIAAAPKLLDALEVLLASGGELLEGAYEARAAIAKARGTKPC